MYYDICKSPVGDIIAVKEKKGLCRLGFQHGNNPVQIPAHWKRDKKELKEIFNQINAYFSGELFVFDIRIAPLGTRFQMSVWSALMKIPYGQTASYGEIAAAIGNPKACRAVGTANGKNPIPIIIPCHRVIGANGRLAGFSSGIKIKKKLLEMEQIKKTGKKRV